MQKDVGLTMSSPSEPKPPKPKPVKEKGTYLGSVPDDDPVYRDGGWTFVMGTYLNQNKTIEQLVAEYDAKTDDELQDWHAMLSHTDQRRLLGAVNQRIERRLKEQQAGSSQRTS
jgi:hypothetical protein